MDKKKIAIFAIGWASDILYQYLSGIKEGLEKDNADMYLFMCHPALTETDEYIRGEINIFNLPNLADFDGAMVFANGIDFPEDLERINRRCKEAAIPVVCTADITQDTFVVGADNRKGMGDLCRHVISEHRAKNIWFFAGSKESLDSEIRLQMVADVMQEFGLTLKEEDIFYSNWDPKCIMKHMRRLLSDKVALPDAIICANDMIAMLVCIELRSCGISVPEDIIVTGFDNEYSARIFDPSITSVNQRFDRIGKKSVEILLDFLAGKECPGKTYIPCEFIPSESCGCAPHMDCCNARKELGRTEYLKRLNTSAFDHKLTMMEHMVMRGKAYEDLSKNLETIHNDFNSYEGESFHILLDPLLEKSISNHELVMRKEGYPQVMDVVYSSDMGELKTYLSFESRLLVPQNNCPEKNRFFMFLPLHEDSDVLGYLIFADDIEKVRDDSLLRKYVERMNTILIAFFRTLRLDNMHHRLLEMTQTDALTHVKNRTAYEAREWAINGRIQKGENLSFAVVVFDLNDLKKVNDRWGHEAGDEYIINSCRLICDIFKRSAVYRIGGDEFAVILENDDFASRFELMAQLEKAMSELCNGNRPDQEKVFVAAGLETYDSALDTCVEDVFKRADAKMYENKIAMKVGR